VTPAEIEAFVNSGPVSLSLSLPSVGVVDKRGQVLHAVASNDKIAVFTGDRDRDPLVFPFTAPPIADDTTLRVQVTRPFPAPVLRFTKVRPGAPEMQGFLDALDDFESENKSALRAKATEAMDLVQVWTEPPKTTIVHYMTWFEYSPDERKRGPRGIVAVSEDGKRLVGRTFPGYEDEAEQWNRWVNLPANPKLALEAVADESGRYVVFSGPREMIGHSWEDAATRALYDYAAEVFQATNRSVFA
jgi:hypothetical protein